MSRAKDSEPHSSNLNGQPAKTAAPPAYSSQSMRASAPQRNEKKQEYANIYQSFLPFCGFPPHFFPEQTCKTQFPAHTAATLLPIIIPASKKTTQKNTGLRENPCKNIGNIKALTLEKSTQKH